MAIYKLSEVCASITETKKSSLPQKVINTSDVFNGTINWAVEENKVLGQFKKTATTNDILFSEIRPGNGRWALVSEDISDCLISTKLLVIRANSEIIIPRFLYKLITVILNSEIVRIANSRSGTFPQITFSTISNISFNLPSIHDQQKIIDIIEPIEKIINKNKSNYSCIYKMLNNSGALKITDYSEIISSGFAYKKGDYSINGKYKVFKTKNINNDQFIKTDIVKNNLSIIGDVVTGMSGTVGTAGVITMNNIVTNQRTALIRTDIPYTIKKSIENSRKELLSASTGSAQPNITMDDIRKIKLKVKDIDLERNLNKILLNIDMQVRILNKILNKQIKLLLK